MLVDEYFFFCCTWIVNSADKEDRRDDASREETAHKVAWAAVKHEYAKGDDDKWHKKS
ncbi:ChaB family protein [Escherichia coli]|uniref:ChaB family protein n=1 Tax=Escherichia coli TaxID=562 RepID=UPI00288BE9A8|nr:ChaB family protein [Escherichia coli]